MPISQDTLRAAAACRNVRPSIPKIAGSPLSPLTVRPNFSNELLQSGATWPQDVNYLCDTYGEIYDKWHTIPFDTPEQQKSLYDVTEPKLEELVQGLKDVSQQRSGRADLYKAT